MDKCDFCDNYLMNKKFDKKYGLSDSGEKMKHDYTVALVIHSWYSSIRKKKDAGRVVHYRHNGFGYKLNYCPECGRKLHGKQR